MTYLSVKRDSFDCYMCCLFQKDECDGVLPVTVHVLSNELEGHLVDNKMALIVECNDLPNVVHRA